MIAGAGLSLLPKSAQHTPAISTAPPPSGQPVPIQKVQPSRIVATVPAAARSAMPRSR